ncbi:hypothetical protein A1353_23945 [Methylomonas methanica]|uniref:Uncharacterized protein n=1 Tax=Methylomonas methanica TaxID=421 RepID=A0A177LW44_METMH|nr:hypothetical protein [Methylomonas methanica]OAH96748.1 hypothetical protein A1353_23945 [Methylomonas methanica]
MTLIAQSSVSATMTETGTVRYLNQYRCPYCQTEWEDVWDCGCNDRCPDCNKEIEPYESALIDGESVETESPVEEPPLANATPEDMNRRFVVSYEIDYVHRVSVGITADSPEAAQQIAEQAFNDASIWDDTAAMPLLSDEYHEVEGESLVWESVAVAQLPEPDYSVRQLKQEQAAMRVCRGLIEAYQQGETNGGSIDWEDLDQLIPVAMQALGKTALEIKS